MLSDESLANLQRWIVKHWYAVLIVVLAVLVLLVSTVRGGFVGGGGRVGCGYVWVWLGWFGCAWVGGCMRGCARLRQCVCMYESISYQLLNH